MTTQKSTAAVTTTRRLQTGQWPVPGRDIPDGVLPRHIADERPETRTQQQQSSNSPERRPCSAMAQFIEQAPGPRGSPQEPQGADCGEERLALPETANTERRRSTRALSHLGHATRAFPLTNLSKRDSQSRQRYS